jgi:benzoyl-CoA reductase/2-hydroxyglutaryl-CoA dehydratase subunit BcrC/BadD/HgdB
MIVGENTCDGKKKAYESLNELVDRLYVMDMPQMKTEQGRDLLKTEFKRTATLRSNAPSSHPIRNGWTR